MDKNIPLSELIRIGSKVTEQNFCSLSSGRGKYTCANGAALAAKMGETDLSGVGRSQCCQTLGISEALFCRIAHLNDAYRFTREQIADILEKEGL